MAKLLAKLALFCLLLGVPFIFPAVLMVRSGEYRSLVSVIKEQRDYSRTTLYMNLFSDFENVYKRMAVADRQPDILTVGGSRMHQFRSKFFKPGVNFYNGAFAASGFEDYINLLHAFDPNHRPKILIVSLDYLNFDPVRRADMKSFAPFDDRTALGNVIRGDWRELYYYPLIHKITWSSIWDMLKGGRRADGNTAYIGLRANIEKGGVRNDGSYRWALRIDTSEDWMVSRQHIDDVVARIGPGKGAWEFADTISEEGIIALKEFLSQAAQDHIYVIGILPPFSHRIHAAIETLHDDREKSMEELPARLRQVFAGYDSVVYDFSDPTAFGSSDAEMLDEHHASEKAALRMSIDMAEQDPVLAAYVDVPYLKSQLNSTTSNTEVFYNQL